MISVKTLKIRRKKLINKKKIYFIFVKKNLKFYKFHFFEIKLIKKIIFL